MPSRLGRGRVRSWVTAEITIGFVTIAQWRVLAARSICAPASEAGEYLFQEPDQLRGAYALSPSKDFGRPLADEVKSAAAASRTKTFRIPRSRSPSVSWSSISAAKTALSLLHSMSGCSWLVNVSRRGPRAWHKPASIQTCGGLPGRWRHIRSRNTNW